MLIPDGFKFGRADLKTCTKVKLESTVDICVFSLVYIDMRGVHNFI